MKKFFASAAFVIAFAAYIYTNHSSTSTAAVTPVTNVVANSDISGATASAAATAAGASPPVASVASTVTTAQKATTVTTTSTGQYKDGTYTGTAANAYYGNIQVAAVISGGKLTNVTILQYPNDRHESVSINQRALPVLTSEAITAQSAKVSGVSGASDTSAAFKQSLSSALSQAASL